MARTRTKTITLGGEEMTVSTLTLGELGQVLPKFKAYLALVSDGGLLAEGGIEVATEILAGGLRRPKEEIAGLRGDITEIALAIMAIGEVCGLEFAAPGEAQAGTATMGSSSAPSMPPSPQDAATATTASTE